MLRERVITAGVLITGFLAALFLAPEAVWVALVVLVAGAAAWEWCGLLGLGGLVRGAFATATAVMCALLALPGTEDFRWIVHAASVGFWLLIAPFWMLRRWRPGAFTGGLAGWVVLLPTALALIDLRAIDPGLLLGVMGLVWVADIAAYFTGRAFGRTRLAPSISPGKTREGAYGALVGVFICGMLLYSVGGVVANSSPILVAVFLPLFAILSIVGDLFESLLKRLAGVKDSGALLPGHGGVLDRIDSLTPTMPLVALIAAWSGW